jgi:hypothetical protein
MSQGIRAEIERVAHDLYERRGREEGKDLINCGPRRRSSWAISPFPAGLPGRMPAQKKDPSSRRRVRNGRKRHAASSPCTKDIASQRLGGDRIPLPIKLIPRARRRKS